MASYTYYQGKIISDLETFFRKKFTIWRNTYPLHPSRYYNIKSQLTFDIFQPVWCSTTLALLSFLLLDRTSFGRKDRIPEFYDLLLTIHHLILKLNKYIHLRKAAQAVETEPKIVQKNQVSKNLASLFFIIFCLLPNLFSH